MGEKRKKEASMGRRAFKSAFAWGVGKNLSGRFATTTRTPTTVATATILAAFAIGRLAFGLRAWWSFCRRTILASR